MKKSMLALAVLGAFAGAASAQSSVTLFGIVDVNARWVDNDGPGSRKTLSNDGINASRIGVRGIEDLGGGLRAGFWLESAVAADVGNAGSGGKFWNRRATVSLMGAFGEVRLGRDYVPTFWNTTVFDPFGTLGVGNGNSIANFNATPPGNNLNAAAFPASASSYTRNDNSIGYFLPPNIGGVYGQAMVAAGEGAAGRYVGGRVGWAGGPLNVAGAYGRTKANPANTIDYDSANIGASFQMGPVRLMGYVAREELDLPGGLDPRETRGILGTRITVGTGEIRASVGYSSVEERGGFVNEDARLIALGYIHNLSKRTAVYTAIAHLDNKGNSATGGRLSISQGNPAIRPGGTSKGAEVGVSHSF